MNKNIYYLSCGRWLDKTAFIRYFEKKVLKTIRKYNLIDNNDKIAVAFSGGKDSLVLLYLLNKFYKSRQQIIGLSIDEGIPGYRNKILRDSEKFLKEQGIKIKIFTFKKELGFTLSNKTKKIKELGITNCYVCSVLKRWLLNKKAKQLGFNVIATAHSLDDESETVILNILKGNPELLAKLGPSTGIKQTKEFVQRIKPFYFCSTKEIVLYAKLNKIPIPSKKIYICPLRGLTFRVEIREWLAELEKKHIEVKNAIVNSLLKMSPMLKKNYRAHKFKKCKKCKAPSSHEFCRVCIILNQLKK